MLARVALVLLLGACGADPGGIAVVHDPCQPVVVVPAGDASAGERASIDAAIGFWNAVAGARLTVNDAEGAPRVPVIFRDAAPNFFGLYEDRLGEILINRYLDDGAARAVVVAHKLGHSFGLVHVSDKRSVMVAGNVTVAPSAVNAAALVALWGACAR